MINSVIKSDPNGGGEAAPLPPRPGSLSEVRKMVLYALIHINFK